MEHEQELAESRTSDPHRHVDAKRAEIHVNGKPVHVLGHSQTGLEIKKAAIAQHVKIELDFLLYLLRHHQPNMPISDDEDVHVTDESRFHAIADDDNS